MLLGTSSRAQSNAAFPRSKENLWVYELIDQLWAWSYDTRYTPPPMTRRVVADSILIGCANLAGKGKANSDVKKLNAKIADLGTGRIPSKREFAELFDGIANEAFSVCTTDGIHEHIVKMRRLVRDFSMDLAAKGLDAKELESQLAEADLRLVHDAKTSVTIESSERPFPDTKKNHWAYEAITRLRTNGILVGYGPWNMLGSYFFTRREFALRIRSATSRLGGLMEQPTVKLTELRNRIRHYQSSKEPDSRELAEIRQQQEELLDSLAWVKGSDADVYDLARLALEFGPDLNALGIDPIRVQRDLSKMRTQVQQLNGTLLPSFDSKEVEHK